MLAEKITWPRKTRELVDRFFDSTVWNDFRFRPDDVVIASYAKAGTTWTQQIVGQLIFGGCGDIDVAKLSPWLDFRLTPKAETMRALEAQQHRRFIKSHLPADAMVFSLAAKYIYVARDGRDVLWSLHNHLAKYTDDVYRELNAQAGPPLVRPPADIRQFFLDWLERDGHPIWSFWESVSSWWAVRRLPNVLMVHYADLKRDLPGQVRRIAAFLDIEADEASLDAAVRHASFDHMKAHASLYAPLGGVRWQGGAPTFFHAGTNGRWRDVLSPLDRRRYEAVAQDRLGWACARWLANGGPVSEAGFFS